MLVDFFITGVQKGGTTALDFYLRSHPQVQMAAKKELHYFDDETIDWGNPDYSRLQSQFDWNVRNVKRGEATPIYIYWPQSIARLHRHNPAAKIIVGLRHPSFRAFSHWRMEMERGLDTLPFDQAISPGGRQRVRLAPEGVHRIFSYVERGLYSQQIGRLLTIFPARQVHFFRTDKLWHDYENVFRKAQQFLGLDERVYKDRRYIAPLDSTHVGNLVPSLRAKLDHLFAPDIRQTASLTGMDLTDWLAPSYDEGIG